MKIRWHILACVALALAVSASVADTPQPTATATPVTGQTAAPATEQGQTAAPATEQGQTAAPATEQGQTAAPATEQGQTAAPATEQEQTAAPATEQGQTAAPATEQGQTAAPATEQEQTAAPATEQGQTAAPATEQGQTAAPATEQGQTAAPATEQGQTAAPETGQAAASEKPPATVAAPPAAPATPPQVPATGSADHTKFEALQKDFKTGPEVTQACLSCHTEAAKHVMKTKHWTWEYTDKSGKLLGKKNVINNYCTTTVSNEADCMACHAGYGWKDNTFDFKNENNVDCLVCHDSTGTYRKLSGDAGHPVYERKEFPHGSGKLIDAVDLQLVAQYVAKPSRSNCGTCHFNGAGGNGTKHGDLDGSLKKPGKYLDVHMDANGLNFSCTTCHKTEDHKVSGSRYEMNAAVTGPAPLRGKHDKTAASCQSCHGDKPHQQNPLLMGQLNAHTEKLACQTCHIPHMARGGIGTEKLWDWSTATKMGEDGKPLVVKDSAGNRAFDSKKGTFSWDSYLIPEYKWFNGQMDTLARGDKIDPRKTVHINQPQGTPGAEDARIWPFKVHLGKQAYDTGHNYLLNVHTAGEDDSALWHNFDWQKAITAGMKAANMPYSGNYGFVSTEMSWPITHMVAPKGDALACVQCHNATDSRLKGIDGVYMPGASGNQYLDWLGWLAALAALVGVLIHGAIRAICVKRKKGGKPCQNQ